MPSFPAAGRFLDSFLRRVNAGSSERFCTYYSSHEEQASLSYGELRALLAPRADLLRGRLAPGELLFILEEDALEQVLWWLAALCAGSVPGILTPPTPKLDPKKYIHDLSEVLAAHKGVGLVVGPSIAATLALAPAALEGRIRFNPSELRAAATAGPLRAPAPRAGALIFQQSSGTTGIRKGVLLGEKAVVSQLKAYRAAIGLGPQDVIVSWLPFYHDMGLVACLMSAVYGGVPLVFTSPFTWLGRPDWLLRAIEEHRGTLCWLPNFAYNLMAERVAADGFGPRALESLRLVVDCSEPVLPASVALFEAKFQGIGLRPEALSSCYAMAENVFAVSQSVPGRPLRIESIDAETLERKSLAVPRPGGRRVASSGRVVPGVRVKIRAPRKGPRAGAVGEILIKGACLMDGYYGIGGSAKPFDASGWYATGDVGYLRGGELFVISRAKDMIIRAGRNINPADIEDCVGKVEGLKPGRVAAFGDPNEKEGTEDIVVLAEFGAPRVSDVEEIRRRAHETLASTLDLAVQRVVIVRPGWLVKSSSGKISRSLCRAKFQRMKEAWKTPRLAPHAAADNIGEAEKDCFAYFGAESVIQTPTEVLWPGRVEIGNWVSLGRHGWIQLNTDFSKAERYARQHYPDVPHDFDPAVFGPREPRLRIGDGTAVGNDFLFSCVLSIDIGRHVLMSERVFITDSHHNFENPGLPVGLQANSLGKPVVIKDHAWIGINCCILEGVTVGRHAVVSANSVVTRDVPDFAVVSGNPARVVRFLDQGEREARADRPPQSNGALESALANYIESRLGLRVKADESLFRSGLIDSLESLAILHRLEGLLGKTLDDRKLFAKRPDTVAELLDAAAGL